MDQGMNSIVTFLLLERMVEDHTHSVHGDSTGPASIRDRDTFVLLLPLMMMGSQTSAGAGAGPGQAGGYEGWNPLMLFFLLALLRRD
jgi:hypothetical protein